MVTTIAIRNGMKLAEYKELESSRKSLDTFRF